LGARGADRRRRLLGNVVWGQPPLVIGEDDLDHAIGIIEEAVTSLAAQPVA
jgi:4-aminobutyrate aminotransferase-like enzyme